MAASIKTCMVIIYIFATLAFTVSTAYPSVGFSSTHYSGIEGKDVVIDIVRSGDVELYTTSVEIQVISNTAVESDDFIISSSQVSFQPASTTPAQVVANLLDNSHQEQREEFTLKLTNPYGASISSGYGTAVVTIIDNDDIYRFENTVYEFEENAGTAEIIITREGELSENATGLLIVEDVTAENGIDYVSTMYPKYNFRAQSGRTSVRITLIYDDIVEETETFSLRLTVPTNQGHIDDNGRITTVRIIDSVYRQSTEQLPTTISSEYTPNCYEDSNNCTDADTNEDPELTFILIIVGASVAGVAILLVIIGCICKWRRSKPKPNKRSPSNAPFVNNNEYPLTEDLENPYVDEAMQEQSSNRLTLVSIEEKSLCELDRSGITLHDVIGRGAFSEVYLATATGIESQEESIEVAVKVLKDFEVKTNEFMKELAFLQALDPNPNIIRFIGCCTLEDPFYLVFEYAPKGNLRGHLHSVRQERDSKVLKPAELVKFALDVSKGMEFISSQNCVHRDLATRNVLLGENKVCKLSDFGLARNMAQYHQYSARNSSKLPVRWMALEAIEFNTFTIKTDVWSFGIVLWELVTMGAHPYAGLNGAEVLKMLQDGERLKKPVHCSDDMYQFMLKCWDENPNSRPTFDGICTQLEIMLSDAKGYVKMGDFQKESYVYLPRQTWAQSTKDTLQMNQRNNKGPRTKPKPRNKPQQVSS